ncbi:MAG: hypothetical protein M0R17_01445 [Candidatus Omnitrophica bacterium]|nr:hypothetical protein [Candidatus Omnitrophota bacterium]
MLTKETIDEARVRIENSAAEAVKVIAQASSTAATTLSSAATDATKTIAMAAAEALKVSNIKSSDDHDLLVRLDEKLVGLKEDIGKLNSGYSLKIKDLENEKLNTRDSYPVLYRKGVEDKLEDHENRIRVNTDKITKLWTWGIALIFLLGVIEFLITKFVK